MSTAKLRALFNAGLTYDQIAAANERSEGWRPSRSGVKRKYEALGMPPRRPSNKETIPWNVRSEHNRHLFRHMLSAEARARQGRSLSGTDRKLLARMHELLFGRGAPMVIDYSPDYPDGFFLALRNDADTDVFRAPQHAAQLRIDIQAALHGATSDNDLVNIALADGVGPEVLENAGRNAAAATLRELRSHRPLLTSLSLEEYLGGAPGLTLAQKRVLIDYAKQARRAVPGENDATRWPEAQEVAGAS
jgi:hypothetical protein